MRNVAVDARYMIPNVRGPGDRAIWRTGPQNRSPSYCATQQNAAELMSVDQAQRRHVCFELKALVISLRHAEFVQTASLGEGVDIVETKSLQFGVDAMNDVVELRVVFGGIHFGDAPGGSAALTAEKFLSPAERGEMACVEINIKAERRWVSPQRPVQKCILQEMKPRPPDRGFSFYPAISPSYPSW